MEEINDLYVPKTSVKSIDGFCGFSSGERADGRTLVRAENVSDSSFPSVRPRPRRATLGKYGKIIAALADERLVRIEDGVFLNGDTEIMRDFFFDHEENKIMKVGSYLAVMPTGAYFNTADSTDYGMVGSTFIMGAQGSEIATVDKNFNVISEYTVLGTKPAGALDGSLWAKPKADGGYEMMIYGDHEWYPYESYVRIKWPSLAKKHRAGEVLECSGADREVGKYIRITHTDGEYVYFSGAAPHVEKLINYSVKRVMPSLQQFILLDGRIVGVFCGYDKTGKFICKAYAGAVNNPTSWSEYGGALSADIGGCEEFTGIAEYRGDVLAFTENSVVRLKISDKEITASTLKCDGVRKRDGKSVVSIDGKVYYKGKNGIYVYDGSFPEKISGALDKELFFAVSAKPLEPLPPEELPDDYLGELFPGVTFYDAESPSPAGVYNGRYYVRLEDKIGKSSIYVYNTVSKSWCVEDDPGVTEFFNIEEMLIAVCKDGDGSRLVLWDYDSADMSAVDGYTKDGYLAVEEKVRWFFETGKAFADNQNGTIPTRMFLKARIKSGGSLGAGCICNGESFPRRTVSVSDTRTDNFEIPLSAGGCDTVRLAVYGRGEAEVLGYAVELSRDKG